MPGLLEGKSAIITGASLGIGRAIALEFASQGASLVVNSRGKDGGKALGALVDEIDAAGGKVIASAGSVADFQYTADLIATCIKNFGSVDILANIAGIEEGNKSSITEMDPQIWQRVIDVHLGGTFNTCRHATPHMVAQGGGLIINTGSHAFLGSYGGTAYAAAKGGINSLTAAIAMDLAEANVRCNVVNPGAKTRLSTGDDFEAGIRDLNRRGLLDDARMASALNAQPPDIIAPFYSWLASELAAHYTACLFSTSGMHCGQFSWPTEEIKAVKVPGSNIPWSIEEISSAFRTAT